MSEFCACFFQCITESHHSIKQNYFKTEIWMLSYCNKLLSIRIEHIESATLVSQR